MKRPLKIILAASMPLLMLAAQAAHATPLLFSPKNPDFAPMTNNQNAISTVNENNYLQATLSTPPHVPSSQENLLTSDIMSNLSQHYTSVLTAVSPTGGSLDFGDGSSATYSTQDNVRTVTFYFLDGTSGSVSFYINGEE